MPKILLTPAFIKNELHCPPGKKRIEYCDTSFPGLYIECRATSPGQGTFYLRYKNENGKTCHIKIGRTYELTLTQARNRAKSLKAEILLGADTKAAFKKNEFSMTLKQFANEHYLPFVESRNRACRNDRTMLQKRILPLFGHLPLSDIKRHEIQKFHTSLRDEELAGATCDHYVKLIRHSLNLAVEWEFLDKNPADKIPLFKEDNKRERYLTEEEQERLLASIRVEKNRTIALMVLFLLSTGARRGEAFTATWDNIDIPNKVWRISANNSKSKKVRAVPLNETAIQVLETVPRVEGSPYVFTSARSKSGQFNDIKKSWTRIRERAGLPDLRLHDLRHQYASLLVNGGRSLYEVQAILGHSDPTITMRYAHLSASSLQEAAETAAQRIGNALPQKSPDVPPLAKP